MRKYIIESEKLIKDWDWDNNTKNGISPDKITCGSNNKNIWWICPKCSNHYQLSPKDKSKSEYGCKVCAKKARSLSNRKTKSLGKKTISELYPDLTSEWVECEDPTLTPYTTVRGQIKYLDGNVKLVVENGKHLYQIEHLDILVVHIVLDKKF